MGDKKKNILIAAMLVVIVAIIGVIVTVVVDKTKLLEPSGNQKIIASLEATSQKDVDEYIKKDLERNNYTLEDARIYINPYEVSPLSALMIFHTDEETTVSVTIEGKHGDDLTFDYESDTYHYIPIYALYQNYENKVKVTLGNGQKAEFKIPTGKLEYAFDTKVNVNDLQDDDALYFITTPINMRSFAIDKYGELRWYADAMYYHNIVELENGHLLIGGAKVNSASLSTELLEIDYLGRIYKTYDVDSGYINDFLLKDDGNIILASKKDDRNTYSEYIIEIDGQSGKIVKSWDLYEKLQSIDPDYTDRIDRDDFFYNSGIEYYPETDSLLLTYWGGEFVANLSYNDGSIKWLFGNPEYFTSEFKSVLLKGGEGFVYPKSMHSAKLEGDTLRLFDNGYSTLRSTTDATNLAGSYSSANTYKLSGKNISLITSIDEDRTLFSYALGDYKNDGDDEIVLFGRELVDFDYNAGINLNDYDSLASRLIVKRNAATVLDIEFDWASYSVTKIDLKKDDFSFDDIETFTTLNPSVKEEVTSEIIHEIGKSTQTVPYEFGYSGGVIEHNVLFMSGDEVKLILIDDEKEGAVYELKVKGETESKKIITDLKSGKYYVYVLENGIMYKVDSYIEIS